MQKRICLSGTITCFLSLILLLVLTLITVTIESARVRAARAYTDSLTDLAAQSVLSDYYLPLFDEYHIFGVDSDLLTSSLQDILADNLNGSEDAFSLLPLSLTGASVDDSATLLNYDGSMFRREAVSYMKYRSITQAAEGLLSSLNIFKKADDTMTLINGQTMAEQELVEIDTCILSLFECIDGIKCGDNGIMMNKNNQIKVASSFVKKLATGNPTAQNMGINHPQLFESLHSHYVNPLTLVDNLRTAGEEYLKHNCAVGDILQQMKDSEDIVELLILETELEKHTLLALEATFTYNSDLNALEDFNDASYKSNRRGSLLISVIKARQNTARSHIHTYENTLASAVSWVDSALYDELSNNLSVMKQYLSEDVNGAERIYDFAAMEATLAHNTGVMDKLCTIDSPSIPSRTTSDDWYASLASIETLYSQYRYDGLCFDYSEMKLESSEQSPAGSFTSLLESGIAGLLINDMDAVSKKELSMQDLPSLCLDQGTEATVDVSGKSLTDSGNVFSIFQNGLSLESIGPILAEGASGLVEETLFLSYLTDHFTNYLSKQPDQNKSLTYELEYLLCGNAKDEANVSSIATRIFLLRSVFCFIHVISDSEKTSTAQAFASAVLGFTGLPILVSLLKYLILIIWAFEGALVETAAILNGKKVDIIPTKKSFCVQFSELIMMSKATIQSKANSFPDGVGIKMGYSEYLLLFLLIQKESTQNVRALDLIQENLRLRYEDSFRMKNICYGLNVTANYKLKPMFLKIPLITNPEYRASDGYTFSRKTGAVYQ